MKKFARVAAGFLAAALLLGILPVSAENSSWLVPKTQEAPAFTDTAETICADAARICCEAGLMTGISDRHFMPEYGLTNAQIIVISARLHRLLKTGSNSGFDSPQLPQDQWWSPYDKYLREQIPELAKEEDYAFMCEGSSHSCYRGTFLQMLGTVLDHTGTVLPEINAVKAVPDCCDPDIMRFYCAGVLGGKDAYGTFEGSAPLSRAAAAAMLARLIDPAQRQTLALQQLELCQELLNVPPDTVLFSVGGQEVTAEQFMPTFAETLDYYNHGHFAAKTLEMNGLRAEDVAVRDAARMVQAEALARESGLAVPEPSAVYYDGYKGLTAAGQTWDSLHKTLLGLVEIKEDAPLPEIQFAEIWDTLPRSDAASKLYRLPSWRRIP